MPVRKKSQQIEVDEQVDWAPKVEEKKVIADLRETLDDIKRKDGVVGYIIRGTTSASVDIKDPSKIIEYASLSAEALESSETLSSTFGLGKIYSIILEGKTLKVLFMTKDEQQLSIFMDKSVDHEEIRREIEYN
jgi:predicted regulator of Ras-like GTPase activity (Roadblock/LC7/MglB family)